MRTKASAISKQSKTFCVVVSATNLRWQRAGNSKTFRIPITAPEIEYKLSSVSANTKTNVTVIIITKLLTKLIFQQVQVLLSLVEFGCWVEALLGLWSFCSQFSSPPTWGSSTSWMPSTKNSQALNTGCMTSRAEYVSWTQNSNFTIFTHMSALGSNSVINGSTILSAHAQQHRLENRVQRLHIRKKLRPVIFTKFSGFLASRMIGNKTPIPSN